MLSSVLNLLTFQWKNTESRLVRTDCVLFIAWRVVKASVSAKSQSDDCIHTKGTVGQIAFICERERVSIATTITK